MATTLSPLALAKSQDILQKPQLILKIDGYSTILGIGDIKKYIRIGDPGLLIGEDWVIGGFNSNEDQLDVITLQGSSNAIAQQLLQDQGGTSSVSSIQIGLIDKDNKITELITPGIVIEDILGRKAEVFLGYQDTSYPQDFTRIFSGIIDEVQAGSIIVLNIAHPELKKRGEVFQKTTTKLTQNLNFRSKIIGGILYETRSDVVGSVFVTLSNDTTAGSESVSVAGNNITVHIQAGVTTAGTVRNLLENSVGALSLVNVSVESGASSLAQVASGPDALGSDTTINVESTQGFLLPVPSEGFRTYVRINDEVIEYTGLTDTTFTGCTREALVAKDARALGQSARIDDAVDSFYRLEGNAIDIALKVLMSGGPEYFAEDVPIKTFVDVEEVGLVPNGVYYEGVNLKDKYGLVSGDFVTITGDADPANNVTDAPIQDIVVSDFGSYLILAGAALTTQLTTGAVSKFKTKYNLLPEGAGLGFGGDQVDVPEFERIKEIFDSSLFDYDFYLKDVVTGTDFIDQEVLFPTGCFSLPRKGKISLGFTAPPLGDRGLVTLDDTNTSRPDQMKITRSINRYFYNNVIFIYNESVVDDKLTSGDLRDDQDSKNRIKNVGNKTLTIKARGLRPTTKTAGNIDLLNRRFLERYKFGCEKIQIKGFYGDVFASDVGDVVVFGAPALQIPDTKKGNRNFKPRLFEIQNKNLNIQSGDVSLDLLDTAYSIEDGRFGIVSPASQTDMGSTNSLVKIKNSYGVVFPRIEKSKWLDYIGLRVIVHDDDWTEYAEATLKSFSGGNDYVMLLDPPLPFVPGENYIVELCPYPDNDSPDDQALAKILFVYANPTVAITAGTDNFSFEVDPSDVDKFLVDATLLVRTEYFETFSPEVKVDSIVGNLITVSKDLGFTPDNTYFIDLIGFKDGGAPYRFL